MTRHQPATFQELTIARSKKRAENGWDFLDDDAQAQVALAQFATVNGD